MLSHDMLVVLRADSSQGLCGCSLATVCRLCCNFRAVNKIFQQDLSADVSLGLPAALHLTGCKQPELQREHLTASQPQFAGHCSGAAGEQGPDWQQQLFAWPCNLWPTHQLQLLTAVISADIS